MRTEYSITLALACLFLLLAPSVALGAKRQVSSPIYATMTDELYGGCAVYIEIPTNLNCPVQSNGRGWVTFGCTGQFGSIGTASKAFEQAQVAMLEGSNLIMVIDDQQKQAGTCFAYRTILQ